MGWERIYYQPQTLNDMIWKASILFLTYSSYPCVTPFPGCDCSSPRPSHKESMANQCTEMLGCDLHPTWRASGT